MYIKDLFEEKKVVLSFEIFPPKVTYPIETVYSTIEALSSLTPDYISVTYGAGGSTNDNRTCELTSLVKNKYGVEPLAHLTCINSSREQIDSVLENLKKNSVNNILALRGDISRDSENIGDFNQACELIKYIKSKNKFHLSAACYPEGHIENRNLARDIEFLKMKVDAGADHLITQLFFDNNLFYDFSNKVEQKKIKLPIQAGIMPVTNKKQIERVVSLCGATLPEKFIKIINRYEHDKEALRDAGIAYAIDQIVDLISTGIRGIHLYTMNNPYVATKISEGVASLLKSINNKEAV